MRMTRTGEPYSVARRAVLNDDDVTVEQAIGRMIAAIKVYLAGKGRWLVPHGFEVAAIEGRTAVFRLPVIWEPVRGALVARASEEPSAANLDELRGLIEEALRSGEWLPGSTRLTWAATMPVGPRPGDLTWTVEARFSG